MRLKLINYQTISVTSGNIYYQWYFLQLGGVPLNNSVGGFTSPVASYFSHYLDSWFRIKFNIF